MKEQLKDYEGLYEIDTEGNIYSVDRYNIDKNGKKKFYPGKKLKQEIVERGHTNYRRVTLCKNGKTKRYSVHRLVANQFIENIDNKPEVNHLDNNGENNCIDNLIWCTGSENMLHAQEQGRLTAAQKAGGKQAALAMKHKRDERVKKSIGQIHNSWEILSHDDSKKITYVFAKCLKCDRTYSVHLGHILQGISKNCRSCGLKKKI